MQTFSRSNSTRFPILDQENTVMTAGLEDERKCAFQNDILLTKTTRGKKKIEILKPKDRSYQLQCQLHPNNAYR
jgi:hypothetical protein